MLRRETCNFLDEHALGMETEMDGECRCLESPLAPLRGESSKCRGRHLPAIVADSPTARRFRKGYRLLVIEWLFGTVVGDGATAAPERPNNKKMIRKFFLN